MRAKIGTLGVAGGEVEASDSRSGGNSGSSRVARDGTMGGIGVAVAVGSRGEEGVVGRTGGRRHANSRVPDAAPPLGPKEELEGGPHGVVGWLWPLPETHLAAHSSTLGIRRISAGWM